MNIRHFGRPCLGMLFVVALAAWLGLARPALGQDAAQAVDARVAELIQQLGAEEFATREKAQAELGELGLEAFDALHAAQNDNDPEIALRARHLVRSMNVRWFQDSDSPDAVKILRGYGEQTSEERRNRMDQLARLESPQGVPALCRLARFETIDVLSKAAALKVMEQPAIEEPAARDELAKTITTVVGNSKRPAATWLRLFARTLVDPASALADWDAATQAEHDTMSKHPETTNREIVRDLYRWQVELLKRLGKDEQAVDVIRRTFVLNQGTPEEVKELVGWLIHAQKYEVVLEVAERFKATFDETPELLYRLAESQLKLGRAEEGQATAERALAVAPENQDAHLLVAIKLQDLGLHDWSEREFRHVIKLSPAGSVHDFRARFYLSEMLHDQAKELAAAEALQPICDLMDKDASAKETCARAGRPDSEGVYSRMHFFYACAATEKGQAAEAEARLDKAISHDPSDVDAIIALFRLPNPSDERKAKTQALIDSTAKQFRMQLEVFKQNAEQNPNEQSQNYYNQQVALMCNQLAWLVGNTTGDYDEAVRLSQRSLEIRPDYPGYLDTLGRCYFAKGDLDNAVKYQSQAVKLDPHSGQIRRQLELFKKEQAARSGKSE